jgi:hypothetical protein
LFITVVPWLFGLGLTQPPCDCDSFTAAKISRQVPDLKKKG